MADETLLPFVRTAKETVFPTSRSSRSFAKTAGRSGASTTPWPNTTPQPWYRGACPRRNGENARDAFLYLLNFIALGFWTVALWQIWDDLVRRWSPTADRTGTTLREDIAWQVAALVVTFPSSG